jgi:pimeloyl-ACP methyl ester carboxylesterase
MWSTSAGTGVPVVLIHGAFSDYRYWELQQISFGRHYRAIALSLRGYYPDEKLTASEVFSADRHVDDVGKFLATLGEPAHLLGHSRGGRIALHVAARFAPFVQSLVLAEPGGTLAPGFLPPGAVIATGIAGTDIRKEAQALIDSNEREAGLRLYVDSGHGVGAWDRSPEIFRRVAVTNARSLSGMIGDSTAAISRDIACQLKSPTLLVGGSRSHPLFRQILDVLQELIPNVSRVTIDGGDHFLNFTMQQEFDDAMLRFWANRTR